MSRRPALFAAGRIPDTLEGRFEAVALYASLALIRLRAERGAEPLAQAFTDRLFRWFDAGLRESGVGDLAVPKRMQKLAGSFFGRLDVYAGAITSDDPAALAAALGRNVFADEAHPFAPQLAEHVLAVARAQAEAGVDALLAPSGWPQPPG